jgi:16S rRNA (guanine1516-N2)-methyltransferase
LENHPLSKFVLIARSPLNLDVEKLVKYFSIEVQNEPLSSAPYFIFENNELKVKTGVGIEVVVDFRSRQYRRNFKPKTDLLCRACGWHLGLRKVWDLTAGLGVDAVMLAQAGFTVHGIERNKYLAVMLTFALEQLKLNPSPEDSFRDRLSFLQGEALALLNSQLDSPKDIPEVIYYDPMYPLKKKSALPSKEMQALRELNGTSGEDPELLLRALELGTKRIVVKRPLRAPPVIAKPTAEMIGKLVRYDIYSPRC